MIAPFQAKIDYHPLSRQTYLNSQIFFLHWNTHPFQTDSKNDPFCQHIPTHGYIESAPAPHPGGLRQHE